MRTHVSRTVSADPKYNTSVSHSANIQSLVGALTLTRLNYGCSTMAGLPERQLNRLQSVINAAARLVNSARRTEHVSPLFRALLWLRVPQRIEFEFRLAVLALTIQRCSISLMGYSELPTSACALSCVLRRRRYFTFHGPITKQSVIGPSLSLPRKSGTVRHL